MDAQSDDRLNIAVIGPSRFPIREPYAGGLEVVVAKEVNALRRRGHRVTLFAAAGSDGHDRRYEFTTMAGASGLGDSFYPPGGYEADAAEFHRLMDHLEVAGFDVVLNHSLSHVPLERAADLAAPVITTLHCPRLEAMQVAFDRLGEKTGRVLAVSRSVLSSWRVPQGAEVLLNGVDLETWGPRAQGRPPLLSRVARSGATHTGAPRADTLRADTLHTGTGHAGAARAVWSGRIVPEKGPHLAVEAARIAGVELDIAGRVGDTRYLAEVLLPAVDDAGESVRVHGPLARDTLVPLVAGADVALVTPCWEEPFGLTAVEALVCGTPVVALARGGMREILDGQPGVILVDPGLDPAAALAAAIPAALTLDRESTARAAAAAFSHEARMARLETHLRAVPVGVAS